MTAILLTGSAGMLGSDLCQVLAGFDLTASTRSTLDITDADAVDQAVAHHDIVINAAAYTAVDLAESDPDAAYAINATAPAHLALSAKRHGARLIHVSTDYVFDGTAQTPYPEDTPRNPQSVYGASKAAGEQAVLAEHPDGSLIVRTAWLYGQHGKHFPSTMLGLAATHDTLSVVTDQVGQPTWSMDVAWMIRSLIEANIPRGIFHATNSGQASWWDFAREIFTTAGLDASRIEPTTSDHFVRPAPRPSWSVLGHEQWGQVGLATPRHWRDAWAEAFPVCFPHTPGGDRL